MTNTEKDEREDNLVTGYAASEQDGAGAADGGESDSAPETERHVDSDITKGVVRSLREQRKEEDRLKNMPKAATSID